jgi:hypothetical protein
MIEEYIVSLLQTRLEQLQDRPSQEANAEELNLCETAINTIWRFSLCIHNYNLINGNNTND